MSVFAFFCSAIILILGRIENVVLVDKNASEVGQLTHAHPYVGGVCDVPVTSLQTYM